MSKTPYKVKLTPYRKELGDIMLRQTPNEAGYSIDGRYQFLLDDNITEADFWVVQGKGLRKNEVCNVAPENTIFLSTEPRSVLNYPKKYLKQFGLISTCQNNVKHPNVILDFPVLPWYIGFQEANDGTVSYTMNYDKLSTGAPVVKTKLISVITSNKAFTKGHLERIEFVEKLKKYYGDKLDVYGHGFNSFDDKWDVLAPYKYHIVLENSSQDYYWTEKLSDTYLSESYPFYYGCTNIEKYIPADSLTLIDIHNLEDAISKIDEAIKQDLWVKEHNKIMQCKHLMLTSYNMFEHIAQLCDRLNPNLPKVHTELQPCKTMLNWQNFFNYTFKRNFFKQKQNIRKFFLGNSLSK